jgi:hypothetical protein
MDFSELAGLTVACRGCGLQIERDEQKTSVMVRVWVEQARQYRAEGPFHADCGKRRDLEAHANLKPPNRG